MADSLRSSEVSIKKGVRHLNMTDGLIRQDGEPVFLNGYVAVSKFAMPAIESFELALDFSTCLGGSRHEQIRSGRGW